MPFNPMEQQMLMAQMLQGPNGQRFAVPGGQGGNGQGNGPLIAPGIGAPDYANMGGVSPMGPGVNAPPNGPPFQPIPMGDGPPPLDRGPFVPGGPSPFRPMGGPGQMTDGDMARMGNLPRDLDNPDGMPGGPGMGRTMPADRGGPMPFHGGPFQPQDVQHPTQAIGNAVGEIADAYDRRRQARGPEAPGDDMGNEDKRRRLIEAIMRMRGG